MIWVFVVCLVGLTVAVVLVVTRIEQGPSMLDRVAAIDIITAAFMGFVAVVSAMTGRRDLIALMVALALVGFLSTVTVARFAAVESDEERRILTREELAAQLREEERRPISSARRTASRAQLREEERRPDEAAPVHDVDSLASPREEE